VGKSGFGMDLDIILDALPVVLSVPNFFATATDREKALELADMLAQSEDAFGDLNAGCQLVCVEGFGHKIISPGIHCFEIIVLTFERWKKADRRTGVRVRPDEGVFKRRLLKRLIDS
jgi:hypothetical protein